jgi:hypothetical protein
MAEIEVGKTVTIYEQPSSYLDRYLKTLRRTVEVKSELHQLDINSILQLQQLGDRVVPKDATPDERFVVETNGQKYTIVRAPSGAYIIRRRDEPQRVYSDEGNGRGS